jgi:hydroxymethylbilane synthase
VPLRGNVETRLAKLEAGDCDAALLAAAGLERLGLAGRIRSRLAPGEMLPAAGQGIIGIECRADRADVRSLAAALEHAPTRAALDAERGFAAALGAGCQSPIAAHAIVDGGKLRLSGLAGAADGSRILVDAVAGAVNEASAIGAELAQRLLAAGAGELL